MTPPLMSFKSQFSCAGNSIATHTKTVLPPVFTAIARTKCVAGPSARSASAVSPFATQNADTSPCEYTVRFTDPTLFLAGWHSSLVGGLEL